MLSQWRDVMIKYKFQIHSRPQPVKQQWIASRPQYTYQQRVLQAHPYSIQAELTQNQLSQPASMPIPAIPIQVSPFLNCVQCFTVSLTDLTYKECTPTVRSRFKKKLAYLKDTFLLITLEHSQFSPKTWTKNFECLGPK